MSRDLMRRIGSREAISWYTVAMVYPTSLLFTLYGAGVPITRQTAWPLVLSSLCTSTAMLLLLGAARRLIFDTEAGSRIPLAWRPQLVLAAFAVSLLARAGMIDALLIGFGLADDSRFGYRLLASLPATGAGLVVVAVTVSSARDYARGLERLDGLRSSFDALERSRAAMIERERGRAVELAHAEMVAGLRALGGQADADALNRIRSMIERVVRPVSRRLHEPREHALAFPEAVASPAGWNDVLEGLFTRGSLK
ncbi:MAG: hypothetical protein QM606_01245, partial [Leucobacter sp.]